MGVGVLERDVGGCCEYSGMSTTVPPHELPDRVAVAVSGLVDEYLDCEKQVAALQARKAKLLATGLRVALEHADLVGLTWSVDRDVPVRSMIAEFATAARVHHRTMSKHVSDAYTLLEQFPQTWEELRSGRVSDKHVAVILEHGCRLTDPSDRERYQTLVLPVGVTETPTGLAARCRIIAEQVHPVSLQERHDAAVTGRCVFVNDLDDGMSELRAILTSVQAHGIHNRLTKQAHLVKTTAGTDDTRGTDQIRADLLTDMLLTTDPHHVAEQVGLAPSTLSEIHAEVHVTVPVLTLTHTDTETETGAGTDTSTETGTGTGTGPGTGTGAGTGRGRGVDVDPAVLNGRVPIDPATARRLAGTASGWDRVLTHPITGNVLTVDRYTPNADLKRFLTARDQHCRFPGCRTRHTDIDHTIAWADGGKTTHTNLALLCRRHHVLKHESPWTVTHKPGGTLEWVSPADRHHPHDPSASRGPTTHPPGTVQFHPTHPNETDPPGTEPPSTEPNDAPF